MRWTGAAALLSAVLAVWSPALVHGEEVGQADSLDVYETKHYPILQLPQTIFNYLVYPLGEFTIYAERSELLQRAYGWFTNADYTYGLFPQVQFGGETGTGLAASLFHANLFDRAKQLEAAFAFSGSDRQQGEFAYTDSSLLGRELYLEAEGEFLNSDHEGATVNGGVEDLSGAAARLFAINRFDARATVGWLSHAGPLWLYSKGLTLEGHVGFSRRDFNQQFGPDGPLAGIKGSTAAANTLAGLGTDLSMVSFGAAITWDDRDFEAPQKSISHPLIYQFPGRMLRAQGGVFHSYRDITFPEGGGLVLAEFDYVSGSDDVKFTRLIAEVQRFHTLFWSNRILAARLRLEKVSGVSDGFVPYTDLPTLGGSQRLRGYERGAFRGEGALLFALEYRYPVWDTWNAFLSYEEGQVFDEYGDIDLGELNSSVAAGLSMRTARAFLMSVRIAHSEDENALIGFAMEQEF